MSGHNRSFFPQMALSGELDLFHIRYNAAHRGAETESFPQMAGEGRTGIVTYTATRWGHLLNPKKMPKGVLPPSASDCYRFVLSNPSVDVCITAPSKAEQMEENLKALDAGPLDEEEMARIRRIGKHIYGK